MPLTSQLVRPIQPIRCKHEALPQTNHRARLRAHPRALAPRRRPVGARLGRAHRAGAAGRAAGATCSTTATTTATTAMAPTATTTASPTEAEEEEARGPRGPLGTASANPSQPPQRSGVPLLDEAAASGALLLPPRTGRMVATSGRRRGKRRGRGGKCAVVCVSHRLTTILAPMRSQSWRPGRR
jgi:hypothetical protein